MSQNLHNALQKLAIWQAFVTIKKTQDSAIQACQAATKLDLDKLTGDGDVKNLSKVLDSLFFEDETLLAYKTFKVFGKFNMSISEYINKFELSLHYKAKSGNP